MMVINQIMAFQTTDDVVFVTKAEAESHQAEIDLLEICNDDHLLGNFAGSYVDYPVLRDWLLEHRDVVLNFLKEGK